MWTIRYEENQMVSRHAGTLPVILSCPHGGTSKLPGVPQRTGSTSGCAPFKTAGDTFTKQITTSIAQLILETLGEAPYVVIADYHRKYIDANRSERCAYETSAAEPFYTEYHRVIREFIGQITTDSGSQAFLFDIHGTTTIEEDPADVYIGTDDGESVRRLLLADPLAMWRRRSLRGLLNAAGYEVSPVEPGIPETPQVNGGFTIRTYGSSHDDGIDAMQIEIAQPVRQDTERRKAFIEHFGRAVCSLAARFATSPRIRSVNA